MKKRSRKSAKKDFEAERQARLALLSRLVDKLDDDSLKISSCELRMYLLDVIDI